MKTCLWSQDNFCDYWDTSCGNRFILLEGDPLENKMKFCPYCGAYIKLNKALEDE